ncbi:hypothetical protein CMEL01_04270 [Colletotrichum melonis]|uniref:Uncharacterized protein n=1 Tax=Colletotrichum melonis TaxID=1209925 RepID=A0AAI9UBW8_9PEZI|nr:hypothetical protein CMEL01_04270 [Colletotrichum melonis]
MLLLQERENHTSVTTLGRIEIRKRPIVNGVGVRLNDARDFLSGVCVLCDSRLPKPGKSQCKCQCCSLSHSSIAHSRHVRPAYAPPGNLILPAFAGTDAKGAKGGRIAETLQLCKRPFFQASVLLPLLHVNDWKPKKG